MREKLSDTDLDALDEVIASYTHAGRGWGPMRLADVSALIAEVRERREEEREAAERMALAAVVRVCSRCQRGEPCPHAMPQANQGTPRDGGCANTPAMRGEE